MAAQSSERRAHVAKPDTIPAPGHPDREYLSGLRLPLAAPAHDPVEHPAHYTSHPSGIECIQITEHMNFCVGNAIKYLWRAGAKGDALEDLKKARFYIDREIRRLTK